MDSCPVDRLGVKEGVFHANHRKRLRQAVVVAFLAIVGTVMVWLPVGFPPPGGLDPAYVLVLVFAPLSFWGLAAAAYRVVQLHVPFYADSDEFQPDRMQVPRRSMLAQFWLDGVRRVRYDEVGRAWHETDWDDSFGRWCMVMYLKDGSEAWVGDGPEVPEEAYSFLLGQLRLRNIPLETDV